MPKTLQEVDRPADEVGEPRVKGPFSEDFEENIRALNDLLGVGKSYDIIFKRFVFHGRHVAVYQVNGLFDTLPVAEILQELAGLDEAELKSPSLQGILQGRLPYHQVTAQENVEPFMWAVMSGPLGVLVEGADQGILVDVRAYPGRKPNEPKTERVIRGPHDSFVETILFNTALIRRRIRDPRLRFEMTTAGQRSHTDIAIGYIEGLTNPKLVAATKQRLDEVIVDGFPSAERAVEEFLTHAPWNPFPKARMTERPDVAANALLEGYVLVIVDTSPQAIITPATYFTHLHHPEDYHLAPLAGTYLRWTVLLATLLSVVLSPLWLLATLHPNALPPAFHALFKPGPAPGLPVALQFILSEIGIDILRRAVLNTPTALASSLGIFGAVVFGQFAVVSGFFSPNVLVVQFFVGLASFAVSSIELAMANRLIRLSLIIVTALFGLPGLIMGTLAWFILAATTHAMGVPYLWPFVPFNWAGARAILFRLPILEQNERPGLVAPLDRQRGR